ncbi:MAG: glycine cleavage system aminomethyltransferase GcvT [Bacteroidota bacterium]
MEIKKVALNDLHEKLGAKMVPFAGFNMPVRYSSDIEEHLAVRKEVGVFDVSHMGEFILRGPKALDLIQRVTSNDASKLFDGKIQYAYLPNEQGGVVDDLLVYRVNAEEYMLVVNASNIDKDFNWIAARNTEGVELTNISDQTALFAVQGPLAAKALQSLTDAKLDSMEYYTFVKADFAGVKDVVISATGYTGAGGFEIYIPNEHAEAVWNKIFEAGAPYHIKPIGLGARDTLRLEMGYCLYGNDIDDTTSPLEAGLGWVTKFTKSFTNSANLLKQKEAGLQRKMVAFTMVDRAIPRSHYDIVNAVGEVIGVVTSGTQSPSLSKGIGMGYVQAAFAYPGTEIFINIRNKPTKAEVVKLPFVK